MGEGGRHGGNWNAGALKRIHRRLDEGVVDADRAWQDTQIANAQLLPDFGA